MRNRVKLPVLLYAAFFSFLSIFFWGGRVFFRAALTIYGSSQARGQIGAIATVLHHSHSKAGPEVCLRLTPQLMAMPDP